MDSDQIRSIAGGGLVKFNATDYETSNDTKKLKSVVRVSSRGWKRRKAQQLYLVVADLGGGNLCFYRIVAPQQRVKTRFWPLNYSIDNYIAHLTKSSSMSREYCSSLSLSLSLSLSCHGRSTRALAIKLWMLQSYENPNMLFKFPVIPELLPPPLNSSRQ